MSKRCSAGQPRGRPRRCGRQSVGRWKRLRPRTATVASSRAGIMLHPNEKRTSSPKERRSMRTADKPMKRKEYEKELRSLQVELCMLQDWVKEKGLRVVMVFEGRD